MAVIYLRSTDGSDADDGSTWALAKATLQAAATAAGAGGTVYVSQAHSEIIAGSTTVGISDCRIICANDSAEPPTSEANTGAINTSSGSYFLTISGQGFFSGLVFQGEAAATNNYFVLNPAGGSGYKQVYAHCKILVPATGTSARLNVGGNAANSIYGNTEFVNTELSVLRDSNGVIATGTFTMRGGSISCLTSGTTGFFAQGNALTGRLGPTTLAGVDLSGLGTTRAIFAASGNFYATAYNCKLAAGWSGSLVSGTLTPGGRYSMYNCDSGDTNYRIWVEDYAGSINSETTIARTGGASDGTTPLAWRMATSAAAIYPLFSLKTDEIVRWNDTVGSAITASVEIVHDSQGAGTGGDFQDDEIWLEVQYLGTSGVPLGSYAVGKSDVLSAAIDHLNSSETWTTAGLTTPVKQTLSVTFTPQEKGYLHTRVCVAKASKTVYVDPLITVS